MLQVLTLQQQVLERSGVINQAKLAKTVISQGKHRQEKQNMYINPNPSIEKRLRENLTAVTFL